jgi:hypothetical protein
MADCIRIKQMSKIMGWDKPKLPLERPCYKHYWEAKSFKNCPICGWSGTFTPAKERKVDKKINL